MIWCHLLYCYLLAFPFVVLDFFFLKMVSSCLSRERSSIPTNFFFSLIIAVFISLFHFLSILNKQGLILMVEESQYIAIGSFFNDKVVSKHLSLYYCLRIIYEESRFENGHCSIYVACLQRVVENMFTMPRCHTLLWLQPNNSHFALTPERVAASFWKQNFWKG